MSQRFFIGKYLQKLRTRCPEAIVISASCGLTIIRSVFQVPASRIESNSPSILFKKLEELRRRVLERVPGSGRLAEGRDRRRQNITSRQLSAA